jgi:hypothetical protein
MGLLSNLMSKIFSHGGVQLRVEQRQDNQRVRPRSGGRGRNRPAVQRQQLRQPPRLNRWMSLRSLMVWRQKIRRNWIGNDQSWI